MKKNFTKKYDNLLLLLLVSVASILIPSGTVFGNTDWVNTKTSGAHLSGEIPGSLRANGTQKYAEPVSFNGNATIITVTSSSGNQQSYTVYNTPEDAKLAAEKGTCYGTCVSASELGLTGTNRSGWDKQIENASNQEKSNGINLDLSDPFSLWQAKETLKMDGYDVDNMSSDEISDAANKIIHEKGKFSEADYAAAAVAVKQTWPLEYYLCSSGSGGPCSEAASEGFAVNVKAAVSAKIRKKTDEGGTCGDDCPGDKECTDSCCPGDPGYPSCGGNEGPEIEWPTISADSCSISFPDIPTPPSKLKPQDSFTGGTCGSTAVKTTYETSSAGCGYVTLLTTTTVTAQLPSAPSIIYAGKGFNWGGVSSVKNVSTTVFDTSKLQVAMAKKQSEIQSYDSAIACVDKAIAKLGTEYSQKMGVCHANVEQECNSCNAPCKNYSCNKTSEDDGIICNPPTCSCSTTCDAGTRCQYLTDAYNESLKALEAQKEAYTQSKELAALELQRLSECGQDAYSMTGATSTVGTVSITNQTMSLGKKYTQAINSIKGVIKNSGLELTAADLSKYEDSESYLKVDTNFFVPYYIKNGTTGSVNGDIVGDISISGYSCPINVTNNILCKDDDCPTTSNLDLIYRPISLTNPFPDVNKNSQYRLMGSNWDETYAEQIIANNRNVKDYNIYNLKPIYTITLTPSTIKEIRNYNKKNSLNNFDMDCSEGYKCMSKFLWEQFNEIIDGSNSCATSTGWDATCYNGGVAE